MASPAFWVTPKQVILSFCRTGVAIIGGGPAGLAPLLAAHRRGRLADLLKEGITVVEQSGSVGEGTIGRWCINSDSTAFTFADCLAGPPDSELAALRNHPLTREFVEAGEATMPLPRAGEFLGLVGQALNEVIEASPNGRVLKGYQAIYADQGYCYRTRADYRFPPCRAGHRCISTRRTPSP